MNALDVYLIGEAEIETAARGNPRHAAALRDALPYLSPGPLLVGDEQAYRAHCREILARVVAGGPALAYATDPEALAYLRALGDQRTDDETLALAALEGRTSGRRARKALQAVRVRLARWR